MTSEPITEAFYSGAMSRISQFMVVLAVIFSAATWFRFGWHVALGFAFGCAIAYLNFYGLKRVVSALADRTVQTGVRQSSAGVVARFLFRYLLIGFGGYVMIKSSFNSLYGLLAGLFLPAAAVGCEAVYELYAALSRER